MKIKIISGGQTGVDRAALDFALNTGKKCGGCCPKDRMAEDGILSLRYPLRESSSAEPFVRTRLNVLDNQATLIIYFDKMDQGTQLTCELAKYHKKPCFIWNILKTRSALPVKQWLEKNDVKVLNIAGPRESNLPGIYEKTLNVLSELF